MRRIALTVDTDNKDIICHLGIEIAQIYLGCSVRTYFIYILRIV